ncbi:MAG: TIGR04283 family arsenosugar biosynthesis glycosyltransferase [Thermodesulfobacteriota bacterium]
MRISAIIPVLNEEENIGPAVRQLQPGCCEVIVSDGGSRDNTLRLARGLACRVLSGPPGRGGQLGRAAAEARGDILLFLHADTRLPRDFDLLIRDALSAPGARFGAFSLGLVPRNRNTDLISFGANLRTRLFSLPYGDQAVFVTRSAYELSGGFRDIPVLEDVDLVLRLRKAGRFSPAAGRVESSSRRWQKEGALKVTLRNYLLLALFLCGVPAARLARWYPRHG